MHAVNACLGRRAYNWQTFLQMCDQFDAVAGLRNTARTAYCAGNNITLFAHALKTAGVNWQTLPLAMYRAGSTDDKKTPARLDMAKATASGAFVYNAGHVWYVKRVGGDKWMKLDSLSGATPTTLDTVWKDGLGVELIFETPSVTVQTSTLPLPVVVTPPATQFPSPFIDEIRVTPRAPSILSGIRVLPSSPQIQRPVFSARRLPSKPSFLGFSKRR
jgi:hypothetical protein